MNLKYKIGSAVAAGVMYAALATPALADTTVVVDGNGAFSHNGVGVSQTNSSVVSQTNVTHVSNHVNTSQNTGGNSASFNVGGTQTVQSGDATANVTVTNVGGGNVNHGDDCGCPDGDVEVEVKDNGAFSHNHVGVRVRNFKYVGQTNVTHFRNSVNTHQNTGWNKANFNVGNGADVGSGNADTTVDVTNIGGGNEN